MLLFSSDKNRKYQCFVCNESFKLYEDFRQHVVSKHEEGREYIICDRCKAPVRDLRLHYKVKHSFHEIPKNSQMRSMVWFDFASNGKRKRRPVTFKEGYFVSAKNRGQAMHYRSGFEAEVYQYLEELNEVARYEVEPKDCVVSYFHGGKWKRYHPDLKVAMSDGSIKVYEIKPANQSDSDINKAKWKYCEEMCQSRGFDFQIITEKQINEMRIKVVKQNKGLLNDSD